MSLVRFRFWARGCSSMVEHQPSKLDTWVRFPSPAVQLNKLCASGSVVEYRLAKARVAGSNPVSRSEEPDSLSGFLLYTDIEDLERWGKDD